jgi:Tfp pilus assembly protein PilF
MQEPAGRWRLKSLRWLIRISLLASLFLPTRVLAQGAYGVSNLQIQVQVRFPDGSAAPVGVFVELQLQNGEMVDQKQTDSSGRCRFTPGSGPAIYLVRVKDPGYQEATVRLDLQNTTSGFANLILRPIPGKAPPTVPKETAGTVVSAADLSVPNNARAEYEKGQHLLQDHDVDAGIPHLKKAIQLYSSFPQAYLLLGLAYNEQKKWKEAQGALERAVQLDPKAIEAYFQLGAALNQLKDFAGAQKALTEGLQIDPNGATASTAHYELARAYMGQGKWQDAEPHASKAIAAQPDFAAGHVLMGNILLKKGDGQGALHEFQEYLRLEPAGPMAAQVKDFIPKLQAAMRKK